VCTLPRSLQEFTNDIRNGPVERFAPSVLPLGADCASRDAMRARWTDKFIAEVWNRLNGAANQEPAAEAGVREGDMGLYIETLREVAQPWTHARQTRAGARVLRGARLRDLEQTLADPRTRVIILVAHAATPDLIEFRDDLHSATQVARCFKQARFDGTAELVSCGGGKDLEAQIRAKTGTRIRIISSQRLVWLGFHVAALRLTIRLLKEEQPRTFIDAFSDAWSRLKHKITT
jgi:hypothetical protein